MQALPAGSTRLASKSCADGWELNRVWTPSSSARAGWFQTLVLLNASCRSFSLCTFQFLPQFLPTHGFVNGILIGRFYQWTDVIGQDDLQTMAPFGE